MLVDGHRSTVSGGLSRADAPSPFWFWPIVVLLACVPAALRVRRPGLNGRVAAMLGAGVVVASVVAAIGRGMHGRSGLDTLALIELAGVWDSRSGRCAGCSPDASYFSYLVIAIVGLWEGLDLLPTLLHP